MNTVTKILFISCWVLFIASWFVAMFSGDMLDYIRTGVVGINALLVGVSGILNRD